MAIHRSGLSLASSRSSRGTGGAMKTTNLPSYSSSRPVAGNTTSSSSYTSMRTSKPLHSSSGRSLPNGPGPTLPNRPTLDDGRLKFIHSYSSSRPVAGNTTSSSSYTSMRTSKPLHSSSGRSLPNGPGPTLPNRPTLDDGRLKFIHSYSSSRPVAGNTTSSSSYTSMRTSKPLHSSSGRSLPNGPGPTLPNRPTFDDGRLKFIASHSGTSTSREGERTSHVSSGKDNAYANNNYRYGSLAGRKSKSLKELNAGDEIIDSSPFYRTRTESFSNRGVSDKMGSHHSSQGSTERDYMSSKPYANTNTRQSLYQSTTHSDYRDPKADDSTRTSLTKPAYSRTLDRDLPIGYGNENNVNIIDVEKTRKASITASPADLKCLRRSSSSSNNSSPWVSSLPWPVLG